MSPELLKHAFCINSYFQKWVKVADLADSSQVYHEFIIRSLSQTKVDKKWAEQSI